MTNSQYSTIDHFLKEEVIDQKMDPTDQEIQLAIHQMSLSFSNLEPFSLVKILYQKMVSLKDKEKKSIPSPNMNLQIHNYPQITILIVKSFYYMGYGYHKFKTLMKNECLPVSINKYSYTKMCEEMALYLYRSLEKLLNLNHFNYKQRQDMEVRELNLWILNYSHNLDQIAKTNLLKFIAKLYDIEEIQFSLKEAIELYRSFQKRFKQQEINEAQTQNLNNQFQESFSQRIFQLNKSGLSFNRLKGEQQECKKTKEKPKNPTLLGNDSYDQIKLQQLQLNNNNNFYDEKSQESYKHFNLISSNERDINADFQFLRDVPSSLSDNYQSC